MTKGQLIPFAFLVILVSGIMISYVFFNTYYGVGYKIQTLQISVIDAISNVVQSLKNYLMLSGSYSNLQSLREHACLGGAVGAAPWIRNSPNPLSVQQSKECLEKYTVYYFDVYYDMFDSSLPVVLTKYNNFSSCKYGVEADKVFAGEYDEGNFWVNCSDATIIVSGINRNVSAIENLNDTDFVTKNRYWYLFRNFYDWAMADVYSPCICSVIGCSCGSSSGEEDCTDCAGPTEDCATTALQDLQVRFDSHVSCRKDKLCCKQGVGPPCMEPTDCIGWENKCQSGIDHSCIEPAQGKNPCPASPGVSESCDGGKVIQQTPIAEPGTTGGTTGGSPLLVLLKTRPPSTTGTTGGTTGTTTTGTTDEEGEEECPPGWYEGRVSAGYKYTCQDFKYYVPSDKGPVPMTFSVTAYAYWRDQDACIGGCCE